MPDVNMARTTSHAQLSRSSLELGDGLTLHLIEVFVCLAFQFRGFR